MTEAGQVSIPVAVPVPRRAARSHRGKRTAPLTIGLLIGMLVVWALAAIPFNAGLVERDAARKNITHTPVSFVLAAWSQARPVLPAPQQIVVEFWNNTVGQKLTSPRNLLYHAWVTAQTALVGLLAGTVYGLLLAVLIIHVPLIERLTVPLIICFQTIPLLAIAPMIVVLMGNIGLSFVWQKAAIVLTGVFFPITLGMVRGLRSPAPELSDLFKTYDASNWQTLWKLRLPAALPYLFPALKIAVAIAVVSTIVAELPTGAQAGLGTRLLVGSYNGLMLNLWATMAMASLMSVTGVALVAVLERLVQPRQAGQTT